MSAQLREWLTREGVLGEPNLRAAVERQLVYGGGLDTAILERGGMSEAALWGRLVAVSGLPAPTPSMCDWSRRAPATPPLLPPEVTGPLRAVPVAAEGLILEMLCAVPVAVDAIQAAARSHGFVARLYVVPETRLMAMRQRVYGEPLPSRYAPLLAQPVRASRPDRAGTVTTPANRAQDQGAFPGLPERHPAWATDDHVERVGTSNGDQGPLEYFLELSGPLSTSGTAPAAADEAPDGEGDFTTAALCRRARDVNDKGRLLALRALRQRLEHPATQALLEDLRAAATDASATAGEAINAIDALGELRDGAAIPGMIDRLARADRSDQAGQVAEAAHRALVATCAQDLGRSRRRWRSWAREHGAQPRMEWLIDGLAHKQLAIRAAALEELRHLSGDSFGYLPDGPKDERSRARSRFAAWWGQLARPEPAISGPLSPSTGQQGAFLAPAEEAPLPPTPKPR